MLSVGFRAVFLGAGRSVLGFFICFCFVLLFWCLVFGVGIGCRVFGVGFW